MKRLALIITIAMTLSALSGCKSATVSLATGALRALNTKIEERNVSEKSFGDVQSLKTAMERAKTCSDKAVRDFDQKYPYSEFGSKKFGKMKNWGFREFADQHIPNETEKQEMLVGLEMINSCYSPNPDQYDNTLVGEVYIILDITITDAYYEYARYYNGEINRGQLKSYLVKVFNKMKQNFRQAVNEKQLQYALDRNASSLRRAQRERNRLLRDINRTIQREALISRIGQYRTHMCRISRRYIMCN